MILFIPNYLCILTISIFAILLISSLLTKFLLIKWQIAILLAICHHFGSFRQTCFPSYHGENHPNRKMKVMISFHSGSNTSASCSILPPRRSDVNRAYASDVAIKWNPDSTFSTNLDHFAPASTSMTISSQLSYQQSKVSSTLALGKT